MNLDNSTGSVLTEAETASSENVTATTEKLAEMGWDREDNTTSQEADIINQEQDISDAADTLPRRKRDARPQSAR